MTREVGLWVLLSMEPTESNLDMPSEVRCWWTRAGVALIADSPHLEQRVFDDGPVDGQGTSCAVDIVRSGSVPSGFGPVFLQETRQRGAVVFAPGVEIPS